MTERSRLGVGLGSLAVFAVLLAFAGGADVRAGEAPDAKALFTETHKCNMCHAVPAAGIEAKTTSEKLKGADLGGKIEIDFEQVASYLRKAGELEGKTHKKEFKGTDEELQAILDWLGSLEAQE